MMYVNIYALVKHDINFNKLFIFTYNVIYKPKYKLLNTLKKNICIQYVLLF